MHIYGREFAVDIKADQSPLMEADHASQGIIMDHLRSTGLPVLSEESESVSYEVRQAWPLFWLVDPLDGTKEFVKRNGDFTVNIALIQAGQPVMGIVHLPAHDETYWGVAGVGACVIAPESRFHSMETVEMHFPTQWKKQRDFSTQWKRFGPIFHSMENLVVSLNPV